MLLRRLATYPLIVLFAFFILGHSLGELLHLSSHLLSLAAQEWSAQYQKGTSFIEGSVVTTRLVLPKREEGHTHPNGRYHVHSSTEHQGPGSPDSHTHSTLIHFLVQNSGSGSSHMPADLLLIISFTNLVNGLFPTPYLPERPELKTRKVFVSSAGIYRAPCLSIPVPPPWMVV